LSKLLFILGSEETAKETTLVGHIVERLAGWGIFLESGGKRLASLGIHLNWLSRLVFLVYDRHRFVPTEEIGMPRIDVCSFGPAELVGISIGSTPNEILNQLVCGSHGLLEKGHNDLMELLFQQGITFEVRLLQQPGEDSDEFVID
jgi:hypothetical protein